MEAIFCVDEPVIAVDSRFETRRETGLENGEDWSSMDVAPKPMSKSQEKRTTTRDLSVRLRWSGGAIQVTENACGGRAEIYRL